MSINLTAAFAGLSLSARAVPDPSPPQAKPDPQPGSSAALASRKVPGEESVRPRGSSKLTDIPADVFMTQIANRLPLADAGRLAAVNTNLRGTMSVYMNDPAHADLTKIRQMTSESLKDHPGVLEAAFAARELLPPQQRGDLMDILAQKLDRTANPEETIQVLDHLYEASQGLASPARAEMLALMSARIDRLPLPVQTAAFSMLVQQTINTLDKADMLVPLQALAGQIHVFPAGQRLSVMGVLAYQNKNSPDPELSAKSLDPPQLARLLPALATALRSTQGEERLQTFDFLRGMTLGLPSAHRLPALEALSLQIGLLPEAERAGALWVNRCEIQSASPDPLLGARVALKRAGELTMPHEDRAWLLGSIVHTAGQLPEGPRATLLREVRQVVAQAQWPGAEDVRSRLDAAGF